MVLLDELLPFPWESYPLLGVMKYFILNTHSLWMIPAEMVVVEKDRSTSSLLKHKTN